MNQERGLNDALRAISNVLFWCFGMTMLLLFVWFGMIVLTGQLVFELYSRFF